MAATKIDLGSGEQVQGTLPVANGGTGQSSATPLFVATAQTMSQTRINERVVPVANPTSPYTINTDVTDLLSITSLTTALTFATSGSPVDGNDLMIRIHAASALALSWPSGCKSSGIAALPTTTVAGRTITIGLVYDSVAVAWICLACDAIGY